MPEQEQKKTLTPRQEKFVQNLLKGMSQRKAYLDAFPNSRKCKNRTIDNKASKLFKENEIKARYNELLEKAQDEAILTAKEMQVMYSDILRGDKKFKDYVITPEGKVIEKEVPTKASDWNKTSELLMKLQGNYTNKVEIDDKTPRVVIVKDLKEDGKTD